MIGDIVYNAKWTLDELSSTVTENENLSRAVLTLLGSREKPPANLAHFERRQPGSARLKHVEIVLRGNPPSAPATLLFQPEIFAEEKLVDVDVYRLNT